MMSSAADSGARNAAAARALLAFWRAAGVDMDDAEAVFQAPMAGRAAAAPRPMPAHAEPRTGPPAVKQRLAPAGDSTLEAARALAAGASSVDALGRALESFTGCALKATARNTVFIDGALGAEVLLVGEAPGKDEDDQGKPFVGRSGQLLDRMLAEIGLERKSNLLISNTIFWRPPGNRDPTQGEIAACLPFAERLVELVAPKLLILTGRVAAQTMLRRDETISRMRGRKLHYQREALARPINAMVMLHPAYLLRRPQEKRLAWADLLMLEAWLADLGGAQS